MKLTAFQATGLAFLVALFIIAVSHTEAADAAVNTKKSPVVLDEESWIQLLEGEWMVDFYAPWCPACKKLEPEWRKFAQWSDDLNIRVASADVTVNPGISGRFMVSGLPTIYHVKDGIFRQYNGARDHTAFINFIEEQKWMKLEPVSKWRAPNTLQMSIVAYAFRISLALRDVHNYLVDQVGMPYYISYLIFALCTVTLGTMLGLLIVFVIDQFCPPRGYDGAQGTAATQRSSAAKGSAGENKKKKKKADKTGASGSEAEDSSSQQDKKPLRRRNVADN